MKFRNLIVAVMLSAGALVAQTPASPGVPDAPSATVNPSTNQPTFKLSASVMSLSGNGQTSAATDIGASFAVTSDISLRSDNIIDPTANVDVFCGGVQYALPTAAILSKTNLDPSHFQFYTTGSLCQDRVTTGGNTKTSIGELFGGGSNYDPTGKGKFSVNLFEVRYAHLPEFTNSTVIVSSGLQIGF